MNKPRRKPRRVVLDWQPIETVPKDGSLVVLTNADTTEISLAHKTFDGEQGWTQYVNGTPMLFQPKLRFTPTHWMPLPDPPKSKRGKR